MQQEQVQIEASNSGNGFKAFVIASLTIVVLALATLLGAYFGGFFQAEAEADGSIVETVNHVVHPDPLVIQLADAGRKPRFLKLSITLGIFVPQGQPTLDVASDPKFQSQLRDRLIFALSHKTSEEVNSAEGRAELKAVAKAVSVEVYPQDAGKVVDVYLTELLIQ